MLVLTRKSGESLLIGDNITLRVLEIDGERVKIGIDAPKEVAILRNELCEEVKSANLQAARLSVDLRAILPSLKKGIGPQSLPIPKAALTEE